MSTPRGLPPVMLLMVTTGAWSHKVTSVKYGKVIGSREERSLGISLCLASFHER